MARATIVISFLSCAGSAKSGERRVAWARRSLGESTHHEALAEIESHDPESVQRPLCSLADEAAPIV
jgi:hypothetical protein